MKVLHAAGRPETGCAVTIGAFDGVHRGHRALIEETRRRAEELGCASAVVTFDRHPAAVVRPDSAPKLLTDLDQKLELLAATGIDYTLVLRFDAERAEESADTFVRDTLIERLHAKAVIVGYDFHFGRGRSGDIKMLRSMGAESGFEVEELSPVQSAQGTTVSSTAIRQALSVGEVEMAAAALGRPFELRGIVVVGDGRGRELGFPTANVQLPEDVLIPADGVYAGEYITIDGTVRSAAISLGTRPQFYENGVNLLEAHLLDFDGDLYGQHARIRFSRRIRGQEKFDSLEGLIAQIERDVAEVRRG